MVSAHEVAVSPADGSAPYSIRGRNVIIDTGTRPRPIKDLPFDGKRVINSDHAVVLEELPKSFIIRGGGAVGVEWASIYGRYGSKVSLVGRVVPAEDEEAAAVLTRAFKRQGIDVFPTARPAASDIDVTDSGVRMRIADANGKETVVEADVLLVAIGRQGNVEDIGLEAIGVKHEDGIIPVDAVMQTNVPNVFAIGDINGQQMLAHTAMHMGVIAVEHIAGQKPYALDVRNSPMVTFCRPEIASVGITEKQAIAEGHNVKTGKFPMKPNGKAVIEGETDGFTKIVADADTKDMLGLTIVGPHATELIGGVGMGRLLEVTPEEIALSVYPHPTVSEVIHEAALDLLGHALHI
jgi:dihydrolipoamide dehydrogenase